MRTAPRRFVPSFNFSYFFDSCLKSVTRYQKNLEKSLKEIVEYLNRGKTKYLNAKSMRKYIKKNLPMRIRNRKIGRQNYFKYAFKNSKEIKFEKNRKKKNRVKRKHKRFVYSYYRLQRNFNKQLIKLQPRLLAKNVFNAQS